MTLAARTRKFSLVVHAVDATGALCGARPVTGWFRSLRWPINCGKCLLSLSRPRYAICESPLGVREARMHVRQVGPEGIMFPRDRPLNVVALCGAVIGWDVGQLTAEDWDAPICLLCRNEMKR